MKIKILILSLFYVNLVIASDEIDKIISNESDQIINPDNIKTFIKEKPIENTQQQNSINSIENNSIKNNSSENNNDSTNKNLAPILNNEDESKKITQDKHESFSIETNDNKSSLNDLQSQYSLSRIKYSILYNDKEIESINNAISNSRAFKASITITPPNPVSDDDVNSRLSEIRNVIKDLKHVKPKNIPAFFLNSIMFKNENNWSIWLNGKEIKSPITKNITIDEQNKIDIKSVSDKYVIFEWQTVFLEDYCPDFRKILTKDKNLGYYSLDSNIVISSDLKNVTFKLKVNQSFVTKTLAIEEGYFESVNIAQ